MWRNMVVTTWGAFTGLFGPLRRIASSFANCHDEKLARDGVASIRQLHWSCREGISGGYGVSSNGCVLSNCSNILDGDDDLELVFYVNIVELVCFNRNRGMQRFLKDRCFTTLASSFHGPCRHHTIVANGLLAEASEVDMVAICVDL